ncbi:MAG: PorV/PorQ family protein [Gemmatimonadota bacterium]|nr:PorV/PorQ family protein [Gemmatimonadota bacterium]
MTLAVLPPPRHIPSPVRPSSRLLACALLALAPLYLPNSVAVGQQAEAEVGLPGLVIPLGARNVGQGRASAALTGDVQGLPYNPAAIASIGRGQVAFSRFESAEAADLTADLVAGAASTDWGIFGVQLVRLDYGAIPITESSPEPVGELEVGEWALGVTYANRWKRIAFGATAKWYASDLGVTDGGSPAFDLGAVARPWPAIPLDVGASLRNLGPDLEYASPSPDDPAAGGGPATGAKLPARLRLGLAWRPEALLGFGPDYRVAFALDAEGDLRDPGTASFHGGASVLVHQLVVLRGGAVVADNPFLEAGEEERNVGGAFGVGIRYRGFEADVAREVSVSELDDETHFSVGYRF